ncbi:hypothetical protein NUSPORA_01878 [Nucleospora cyclopteri]
MFFENIFKPVFNKYYTNVLSCKLSAIIKLYLLKFKIFKKSSQDIYSLFLYLLSNVKPNSQDSLV